MNIHFNVSMIAIAPRTIDLIRFYSPLLYLILAALNVHQAL